MVVVEHRFEYNRCMELGDPATAERDQRSTLDVALDTLDVALTDVIEKVETGGLEQLDAAAKVALWHRFETLRNRLPLIDHALVADAEATDLAGTYCFSTLTRFLVRVLQLSPGEAAARVRAAAAVGPRQSMLGEKLQPVLPRLAGLQRDGVVSTEKVQIVAQAMHKLSRAGLNPDAVDTAEQLLSDYAPVLAPVELRRYALSVVERC